MTIPIISGFHPDPSICRAGDTYYIANSSFEYIPGVPLHSSRDLRHWQLDSNILERPSQLAPHSGTANSGIFAPTLRFHDGRFWLVTTNILEVTRGHIIVTATDPAGPWSDPTYVEGAIGIDPDLAWGDDGTCYLTWASFDPAHHGHIVSARLDPDTGTLLEAPRKLWDGTGLAAPEGPHLYSKDGWWYLLIAEGGTERGHTVAIARSRSAEGPFESNPANPILTHRSTTNPVQNVGHADLIELSGGEWAMVHLGVRIRGFSPSFHVNGRETFITGIDWVDDWPIVREDRYLIDSVDNSFTETFNGTKLNPRWIAPGTSPSTFSRPLTGGGIELTPTADPAQGEHLLSTRPLDNWWSAVARLDVANGDGRLELRINSDHSYGITVSKHTIEVDVRIGPMQATVASAQVSGTVSTVGISAVRPVSGTAGFPAPEPDMIELSYVDPAGAPEVLASIDGRYLSTEVAGGFTGRVLGLAAASGTVRVEEFTYSTILDHN